MYDYNGRPVKVKIEYPPDPDSEDNSELADIVDEKEFKSQEKSINKDIPASQ